MSRASIEDEYARKLLSLCRKSLGSQEMGSLKNSLDTVRGEVESMGKQHQNIAAQMKTELEEPLAAFAGAMKERRKIVQNGIEKILKTKIQQTQHVNKTRDRFEQECLKIKGYLAQGHMVMGQEERKNKAKLEKTQISVATSNTEYENAVKALEDTTARWNREWKAAADKFQDLEEERLDFTKSSLWTFANVSSTVCVSDDASCEKIRLSLEKMDVETDIVGFIKERGTGQEIPDPPKYINFCRGDVNDTQSETSDDDNYSVAQFPRSINPAFRTSSPQPQEPPSGKVSPIKHESVSVPASVPAQAQAPSPASATTEKQVLKKKSGFFQNHSPFRRKSTKEVQGTTTNRNTWHPVSTQGSPSRRPQVYTQDASSLLAGRSTISPEPIDANASLALNVGQNVFSVTTPDLEKRKGSNTPSAQPETDPIALALAELKGVGVGKQSSIRVSADRYHGIATPTPGSQPFSRSVPPAAANAAVTAGLRGTPPPSYDQQVVQRLGVPPQAVTAKAMKETSQKFADQTRSMFSPANRPGSGGYAGSSSPRPMTRAKALYMYQAAIPEELGFSKGDFLAVLRHQDDGWWEAEVHGGNGQIGLVPSNYLQPC
ncbi:formin-binding protein [Colletotrichum tropicale]|nr:formin-binding protein [Colletotrichum tropicale]